MAGALAFSVAVAFDDDLVGVVCEPIDRTLGEEWGGAGMRRDAICAMLDTMKLETFAPAHAVALILLLQLGASARAETPVPGSAPLPPEIESQFRAADADRNQELTKEEARGGQIFFAERFASVDQDQNGIVTLFELATALTTSRRRWMWDFDAADTDRDGVLSEEELATAPASVQRLARGLDTSAQDRLTRERYESTAQRTLYDNVDLPSVVPNIYEKKF